MKRPAFWILFALASLAAAFVGIHYFPRAFSIVALDITMDRDRALGDARTIMARERLGPSDFRQAASFTLDNEAQTFVELEGGGKDVFLRMLREGLYSAYTWRVRQFKEGETHETTIRFTPDGKPYGFIEQLKEDAPGAALDAVGARRIAETDASARWLVDVGRFTLVEQGQERRPGGRVDHTLTYERASLTLNEGRYRLRLVVSGDRLTEVTYFIRIPEAFSRRYASMRSANEAIGVGSVVSMMLLYVFGGIGVGLFFMLRQRWVLWRPAVFWGILVALLQALAAINEFPLLWMTYDTALPRATFITQQVATLVAMFVGFSVFFALSFMAAETLTRRAFGSHPQLWRVWSKGPGSSTTVLGLTAGGYLLVSLFFAYDVVLYLVMTTVFGWWSPSEALLHPDVLATYVPWLSAIANSFQAGFWEEALFRAIPLAGAALIGDRFGKRRLFLVIAFIVQAIVFGAGHAPYPNQPSYARPVELIIPSIGFGLLYIYFGLLPGIVLHFAFDVVWFALPIFLADAPGIWFQQLMVIIMTLVPVWIVLRRRLQVGHWHELSPADRNAAWTPPPAPEPPADAAVHVLHALAPRVKTLWLGLGAAGALVCVAAIVGRDDAGRLPIRRTQAAEIARRALAERGTTLDQRWRVMPIADDGSGAPHEFVADTAGEARRRELLGKYLPQPMWRVRVATFEGDVVERAEEWQVLVSASGEVRTIRHQVPEHRPGATLSEDAARKLAQQAVRDRTGLDAARGDVREVSARPSKLKARTDWTFTFTDTTVPALPQGEPRIAVELAGDQVASTGLFVYVPEEAQRRERAASTRNTILRLVIGGIFGALLVGAAVIGIIAWSRRKYTPRLFVGGAAFMLLLATARFANGWPAAVAALPTALPLPLQMAMLAGLGLVGLTITAALVGLVLGSLPHRLAGSGTLPDREAVSLGMAAGFVGAALLAASGWLQAPAWAHAPNLSGINTFVPLVDVALGSLTGVLTRIAVVLGTLVMIDRLTAGWTRRRALGGAALVVIGLLGAGPPVGVHLGGWPIAGAVTAVGLLAVYVTLLRFDLTMVPISLATMTVISALSRGMQRPFPGALAGTLAAVVATAFLGWWWFRALRRWRAKVAVNAP